MTGLQREIWNEVRDRFLAARQEREVDRQHTLINWFRAAEWDALGNRQYRQNVGSAISAAFGEAEFQGELCNIEKTQVNGSANRMQYRRTA